MATIAEQTESIDLASGVGLPGTPERMHPVYLPFSEAQLGARFAPVAGVADGSPAKHLAYYRASIANYAEFCALGDTRWSLPPQEIKRRAQIQKDERFWVAAALMSVYHAPDRQAAIGGLLRRCLGESPPFEGKASWEACFGSGTELFLEVGLPSPPSYEHWLRTNLKEHQLIPYMRRTAERAKHLEGRTHVDAMLIDGSTGCAVLFEAKVTSDCSCRVSFDAMRNQLARNIDVMLDANIGLQPPLSARRPELSAFVLLTPRVFQENPHTRLYGRLMQEYRTSPSALHRDLPHRAQETTDWHHTLSRRVGWLTFEDCAEVVPGACRWLRTGIDQL